MEMSISRICVGSGYNENLTFNGNMGYINEVGGRKAWRDGWGKWNDLMAKYKYLYLI